MIGTLINALAILVGGTIGMVFRRYIPERLNDPIMAAEGVAILVIGVLGILPRMLTVSSDGTLVSSGELLLLISLVVGIVVGELLKLDERITRAAQSLEKKIGQSGVSEGLVSASLIFCIGAMTIMGPLREVIDGDRSILLIKSLLDGITSIFLAISLGQGVLFSAFPVLLLQGSFALLANALSLVPQIALDQIYLVGYVIVFCIGINFLFGTKVKTANLLPALLVPVLYNLMI